MKAMYEWAWKVRPSQPLTSPVWIRPGYKGAKTRLEMVSFVCENSDILSFHCYYPPRELNTFINMLSRYHRPMICQEYMARTLGSTFQECLPILKREKVDYLCDNEHVHIIDNTHPSFRRMHKRKPRVWPFSFMECSPHCL